MKKPTKEELKELYGISDDHFEILDTLPGEDEVKAKNSWLVKVGECFGSPAWLWKTLGGAVLAVILLTSTVIGHYNNIKPIAVTTWSHFSTMFQSFVPVDVSDSNPSQFVVVVPEDASAYKYQPSNWDWTAAPSTTGVFSLSSIEVQRGGLA
jgi:hypothetical protein